MIHERYITVEDQKFFKDDIAGMNHEQLSALCSFMSTDADLRFIQCHCIESYRHKIDNLLFAIAAYD
jgi:hypothetical protein